MPAKPKTPPDILQNAIEDATRALARKDNLQVEFSNMNSRSDSDNKITLPPIFSNYNHDDLARIRGKADSKAMFLRYHDKKLHNSIIKEYPQQAELFNRFEEIRTQSLGGSKMSGVRHNIESFFNNEYRDFLTDEKLPLAEEIILQARKHIQNMDLPEKLAIYAGNPSTSVKKIIPLLADMRACIDNQKEYARIIGQLVDVVTTSASTNDSKEDKNKKPSDDSDNNKKTPDSGEQENEIVFSSGDSVSSKEQTKIQLSSPQIEQAVEQQGKEENAATHNSPYPYNFDAKSLVNPYHAYTTKFDEITSATKLATPAEIEKLRAQLDERLTRFHTVTSRLANRLQRLLLAKQARKWLFDEEDGIIDSKKLSRVIIKPNYNHIYKLEEETDFRDTVVTLLIDNSGSMRGRPITIAALSADIIAKTLERCGIKVEILGFTTKEWKGGNSYKKWVNDNKPSKPGRLNDLMHIIYKSADSSWRKSRKNLGLMLKEGLLKENIDGEAILWACERLLTRNEQRRILMVISDGAPVDDSTLSCNTGSYLDSHLREVIEYVETKLPIELVAIGIGHDVTRYYKKAITISDIEKLGETMTEQLLDLFR
ncbi:MAG: hypothetical protein R3D71_05125 [Rickettsiales bacterium]